ncbi:hypothetical protein CCHOA_02135 [Corynebacterium choanae]|uniref:Uncharacterized protein n=1 Tax=Corynebacterium choanae TaxID=1862358 RepID=A0A3G6J4I6_9CORY|nr:hypothetical protein CCHOA_02135 [Corynebacterium choanae]
MQGKSVRFPRWNVWRSWQAPATITTHQQPGIAAKGSLPSMLAATGKTARYAHCDTPAKWYAVGEKAYGQYAAANITVQSKPLRSDIFSRNRKTRTTWSVSSKHHSGAPWWGSCLPRKYADGSGDGCAGEVFPPPTQPPTKEEATGMLKISGKHARLCRSNTP